MANAAGDKGERGEKKPSQQGQAGLRLQHALPDARILYVSATGATTVQNLAYAARLGLWGTGDFPFATRADFVAAMEKGGVAATRRAEVSHAPTDATKNRVDLLLGVCRILGQSDLGGALRRH